MVSKAELNRRKEGKLKQCSCRLHQCLADTNASSNRSLSSKILLDSKVEDLVLSLRTGAVKSQDVTMALVKMAHELGRKCCNALTDEMYDQALQRAKEIDEAIRQGKYGHDGASAPLLLGIPISIKEHIDIAGADSTAGTVFRCMQPKEKDSLLVELLKDAGAIMYCKTTVPQCMMLPETASAIFGTTRNPHNKERTSGGSSGGESALIASRGSLLGIGTDIAGSIRIPAHFTGIYGFKPTPWRVSEQGMTLPFRDNRTGQKAVKLVAGPMGLHVDDLTLVLRSWWVKKMWERDAYVVPLPFDMSVYRNGLLNAKKRIGYFLTDNWFKPSRACVRAVLKSKAALERIGYELVEIPLPHDGWEACRLLYGLLLADGGLNGYVKGLEGEPFISLYNKMYIVSALPDFLRPLISLILYVLGEERLRFVSRSLRRKGLSVREYWELIADLDEYKKSWLSMMDQYQIDGFICPASSLPALPHGASVELESSFTYTFFVNLLHFPAGVVPVTKVAKSETVYPFDELPKNQRDSIAKAAAASLVNSEGMPVGVQVITRPYHDEHCLHLMKVLETSIGLKAIPDIVKDYLGNEDIRN